MCERGRAGYKTRQQTSGQNLKITAEYRVNSFKNDNDWGGSCLPKGTADGQSPRTRLSTTPSASLLLSLHNWHPASTSSSSFAQKQQSTRNLISLLCASKHGTDLCLVCTTPNTEYVNELGNRNRHNYYGNGARTYVHFQNIHNFSQGPWTKHAETLWNWACEKRRNLNLGVDG